jgi:hypothetical protein
MGIIHLLRNALEIDIDLSQETDVTEAEKTVLKYADVILPWLWRATQHGIQSDFAQNIVCFLKNRLI